MKEEVKILVVDDEPGMRDSISEWLKEDGYQVFAVESGRKAIRKVKEENWHILLIDLKMPGLDGIQTMKKIRAFKPEVPIIIITAYATVDTAVMAMKEGAYDYLVKPFNPEEVSLMINKIVERQQLLKENILLRKELSKSYKFGDLLGKSPKMQEIFHLIKTIANSKSTILILGESGTGKELVARAIHNSSPRREEPFISLSCGALSESLLEAELFGHEKGAFTDAKFLRQGKIELAEKGTLFLDEIGDISPKTQVDLLGVLQNRVFRRVGGQELINVEARFIAATNKDLKSLIEQEKFREDLYYRLNVITINIPPLRERKEDIPVLAQYFLEKYKIENQKHIQGISQKAMNILLGYDWPGNVRELENTIERALVVCQETMIQSENFPTYITQARETPSVRFSDLSLQEIEKWHINNVLEENEWNIQKSAQILKIDRMTLYRKMKKYNIKRQ
jgi:two-component system response regulator AtoC